MGMDPNALMGGPAPQDAGASAPMPQDSEQPSLDMQGEPQAEPSLDQAGALPPGMEGATAPGPAMPDPSPVMGVILQNLLKVLSREDLDLKVQTDGVSTLATAFKTLADSQNQQQSISPQDQLNLEVEKMNHQHTIDVQKMQMDMELAQQKFELEKAKAILDMQTKKQTAEQDAQMKQDVHQQTLLQSQEQHQQNLAAASTNQDLKVQESEAKRKQMEKGPRVSS